MNPSQKEEIMQNLTSWEEKGMEKGMEKGRRSLVFLLLQQKVGQLPQLLSDRISTMSANQLEALAIALLNFSTIDDLTTWLDNQE
ncbi:DUF4351 domain-containing protein, partial [Phormidesmis sp. 146-33]